MELSETDPRTKNVPIVIDDTGEVLHTAETSPNFGTEKFWDPLAETKGGGKKKGGKQLKPTITIDEARERRIREMARETSSSLRGIKEKEKELDDLRARVEAIQQEEDEEEEARERFSTKQDAFSELRRRRPPFPTGAKKACVSYPSRPLPSRRREPSGAPRKGLTDTARFKGSSSRSGSTRTVMPMTAIRHKVVDNKLLLPICYLASSVFYLGVQEDYSDGSYSRRQSESRRSVEEEYSHRAHNHHKRPRRDIEVESPEPRGRNWDNRESSRNPRKRIRRDESRSLGPSRGSTSQNRDSLDPGKGKGRDYGDAYDGDDAGYDEDYDGYDDGAPPPRYAPTHKSRVR
ncbi:hypothetical protein PQX77_002431 [Marasmius sp. AFHP31]|nr:hypothetical protein PQX77_002431 [Marasmius sp. AFHP31]